MEKSSKRGKIPQQDWPLIITRHDSGETLASIARTYDCSPPAISYIVSRSRERNAAAVPVAMAAEPQLIKSHAADMPAVDPPSGDMPKSLPAVAAALAGPRHEGGSRYEPPPMADARPDPRIEQRARSGNGHIGRAGEGERSPNPIGAPTNGGQPDGFGANHAAMPQNGEHRRTLHLSLGGSPPGNDLPPAPEPQRYGENQRGADQQNSSASGGRFMPRQTSPNERDSGQQGFARYGQGQQHAPGEASAAPSRVNAERQGKETGLYIDQALRDRVGGDIEAFLAAFDQALAQDTQESRLGLREATDRLLRAGARTRIELERLDARVPLPPPAANAGQAGPAWRYR